MFHLISERDTYRDIGEEDKMKRGYITIGNCDPLSVK